MNRIMLDLETLGTAPGSVILSIGAVRIGTPDTFYVNIDVESSVAAGLTMDVSTVMWWMQQSDEARKAFKSGESLDLALAGFSAWCWNPSGKPEIRTPVDEMWGNGADFDNVLLSAAYKAADIKQPWSHRANRCYRTIRALHPDVEWVPPTVAHNALEDAKAQAAHLESMLKK